MLQCSGRRARQAQKGKAQAAGRRRRQDGAQDREERAEGPGARAEEGAGDKCTLVFIAIHHASWEGSWRPMSRLGELGVHVCSRV